MKLDLKLVIVMLAVLVVATVGSAYLTSWVFSSRAPVQVASEVTRVAADPYNPELIWDAGQFTVNLASTTPLSRYVKTSMSFRVNTKAAVGELEKRRVQVQDRVITTLRMTQPSELQEADGITALKQRLLDGINELLVAQGGRAYEVYLSELIIQ